MLGSLYLNSAIITILWAIAPIVQKILLKEFSPAVIMILFSGLYTCCTVVYAIYKRDEVAKALPKIDLRVFTLLVISGVFSGFLANRLYYITLKDYSASVVTAITAVYPLITVLLAYLLLSEKINLVTAFGIVFICMGITMIGYGDYYADIEPYRND